MPATQTPVALQVSPRVHGFPSLHEVPGETGTWKHPDVTLHESVVQSFPSLQLAVAPGWQMPDPLQVSFTVQALRSLQGVPDAAKGPLTQTPDPSQVSALVQRLLSLHWVPDEAGVPWQLPLPLQVSFSVQGLESEQTVPAGEAWTATQLPEPLQASFCEQALPSSHGAPENAGE